MSRSISRTDIFSLTRGDYRFDPEHPPLARMLAHVNLAYFGTADPRDYGIDCTFLPGSPSFVPPELFKIPQFPGYVVVSATHLFGAAFDEARRDY